MGAGSRGSGGGEGRRDHRQGGRLQTKFRGGPSPAPPPGPPRAAPAQEVAGVPSRRGWASVTGLGLPPSTPHVLFAPLIPAHHPPPARRPRDQCHLRRGRRLRPKAQTPDPGLRAEPGAPGPQPAPHPLAERRRWAGVAEGSVGSASVGPRPSLRSTFLLMRLGGGLSRLCWGGRAPLQSASTRGEAAGSRGVRPELRPSGPGGRAALRSPQLVRDGPGAHPDFLFCFALCALGGLVLVCPDLLKGAAYCLGGVPGSQSHPPQGE